MDGKLKIGDEVELIEETRFNEKMGKRWPLGSKGMVEEVRRQVTIRMYDSETSRNGVVVATMATIVRAFRKCSDFN
jgi:hypothetical protein